jgi:hypothetical protein
MSAGGWFDNSDAHYRLSRLTGQADADRLAAAAWKPGRWRCRLGWHDWHEVQMPDHDRCAECSRCGKRDWRRLLLPGLAGWHGGDMPPGA